MTKDEALKLGLQLVATAEYLATDAEICGKDAKEERALIQQSKIAFEEALAQPKQEPVAMRYDFDGYGWLYIDNGSGSNWKEKIKNAEPLYTIPPRREWVGLTDAEIKSEAKYFCNGWYLQNPERLVLLVKTIQAKLREKNGG